MKIEPGPPATPEDLEIAKRSRQMYPYTPAGPAGQTVDVDTVVRAVLATGRSNRERTEEQAVQTLFWLEVSGVELMMDGASFTTTGRSLQGMLRLFIEERRCGDPVDLPADRPSRSENTEIST